jgi:class 3 adenylate cyclase
MTLKEDISVVVKATLADQWATRKGRGVPASEDLGLGNEAVVLDATVLYADLDGSTNMVDNHKWHFSAEVYKTYLYATAKVIRSDGGEIVAYDGDRVMAVFIGDSKNTSAVRCGLKINWVAKNIVMPQIKKQYPDTGFVLRHVVGIDTSELRAARTGIRGSNDLVWVGPAANYAAKLTELSSAYPTWITHRVYDKVMESVKMSAGTNMWEQRRWTAMNDLTIYRSNYSWSI